MEMLLENHSARGHDVIFASIEKPGLAQQYFLEKGIKSDISRADGIIGLFSYLRNQADTIGDFVIVAHGLVPSIFGLIARKTLKIPYGIVHHHQPNYFSCTKNPQVFYKKMMWELMYRKSIKGSIFVHSLSDEVSRKLKSLNYPNNQILNLGHGIDFKKFFMRKNDTEGVCGRGDVLSILMIGRLSWEKNYNLAIDTIENLVERKANVSLCIVGVGPDREFISEYVRKKGLERHVTFLGWRNDIQNLMNSHHIFLHTAYTESYGQVLVEAKLASMNFVSTDVGIARRLESECSNTKISKHFNSVELASLIEELSPKEHNKITGEDQNVYALQQENTDYVYQAMSNFFTNQVENQLAILRGDKC
jgi:glycosyltransferase involved in cell wall biosynthesis